MIIPFLGFSQKTFVPDPLFEAFLESNGFGDSIPFNDSVNTNSLLSIINLDIRNYTISDITGVEDMLNLQNLNASNNNLSDLSPINTLPNLNYLTVVNNSLTNVNFSTINSLVSINLSNNQISQIFLPDSAYNGGNLSLSLTNNVLNYISFPQTLRVYYLNLEDNPLDSIDVSSLNDLYYLNISNSNITSLDLSTNSSIHDLYICQNSSLASLDITNKDNLYYFRISDNISLSSIDLRNVSIFNMNHFYPGGVNPYGTLYGYNFLFNPSLSCISVDNVTVANALLGDNIDPWCSFSANCSGLGCIDPLAMNFDAYAIVDDGSCMYCVYGCTDPIAPNYDLLATCDDGSCGSPTIYGCTNSSATNYNISATFDDGSCAYIKTYVPDDVFEAYLEALGWGDGISFNDSVLTDGLLSLTSININNFSVSDITGVEDMLNLQNFYANYNNLSDLSPLYNLLYLHTLEASFNYLTTVDLSLLNNRLLSISLNDNQISQIILPDSAFNGGTLSLSLNNNILNSIIFPQTLRVYSLSLQDNPFDSLDVSSLTDLYYFNISNSNISFLDLSHNHSLYQLYIYQNSLLTAIDLRNKNNLYTFRIDDNITLSTIDLRNVAIFNMHHTYPGGLWNGQPYGNNFFTNLSLNCISVDNISVADALLGDNIDAWCSFSTNCTGLGCMDSSAINYDPTSIISDSSCLYQLTYIPDDNFESYLESMGWGDGIALNNYVLTSDIALVTYLDVASLSINDLTGIEDFISLTWLDFSGNNLSSLDLRNGNNIAITYIMAFNNPNLSCISVDDSTYSTNNWTGTSFVFAFQHYFSNQCLGALTYGCVDSLAINYNILANSDDGSCRYNKTYVPDDIFEAYLENINYGDGIPFNDSVLTDGLLSILSLNIDNYSISDITGIEDMSNLQNLYANYNNISDLHLINSLSDLHRIEATSNSLSVVDLSSLNNSLTAVYLYNNQISQLILPDSAYNGGVMSLHLQNNILNSISFPQTLRINYLNLNNNPLDTIDVSILYDLRDLYISNSNISSLNLSNNNSLYTLDIYQNSLLTSIDLKNKNNLYNLRIVDNSSLYALDMRNVSIFAINHNNSGLHNNVPYGSNFFYNSSLTCISVSDTIVANALLDDNIDPWCSFSTNCTGLGCMDSLALNYDPNALTDDGTCIYEMLTYVPDDNFETYLESMGWGDGIALNDSVLTINIISVSLLNLNNRYIADLTGIEKFASLRNLYCINNTISDIDLSSNLNLEVLFCDGNQIDTLDLSNNTLLYSLYCNFNQIVSLDVSNNPLLTNFYCAGNLMSTLDISQNTSLIYFSCSGNQLTNLDVSNCIDLLHLQLYSNNITYLDISDNPSLIILDCSSNQLVDLDVSDNPLLSYLGCSANQLDNLDVRNGNNTNISDFYATNNSNLTCISVDDSTYSANNWFNIDIQSNFNNNCLINSKSYVPDNNFENYLEANGMGDGIPLNDSVFTYSIIYVDTLNIQNLSISDLTGIEDFEDLQYLDCSYNPLTSIDISNNEILGSLHCNNNLLDSIDISNNLDLNALHCEGNQLYDLDIVQNTSLLSLHASHNNLSTINLSQNTDLSQLYINHNQLDSIDLSQNNSLGVIHISNNQISSLDLSLNFNLYYLDCSSNQLSELDIRNGNNTNMINNYFYTDNNINLFCINVDDSIYSSNSWSNIDVQSFFSNDCDLIVPGCTDTNAINYNVYANSNDGSCLYSGCTDTNAFNYDPLADFDDGSCIYYGCTDSTACNYNLNASIDDGSCFGYSGCTDSLAFNYDPMASCDNGSCIPIMYGCTDTAAVNYNIFANTDDGSCLFIGCTDSLFCNYNPIVNFDDGSCTGYYGCTDSNAVNYDPLAGCDDGSCSTIILGCTDSLAVNYYSGANFDDGSCLYSGCTDSLALNYDSIASFDDGSCIYYLCQEPAPTNLFASNVVDNKATVNWDNMNSNTCMVLKYVIRYRELGTNSWTTKSGGVGNGLCNFGVNTTSKLLQNLNHSTTYQYKIKAYYCFGGSSTWSLPKYFTTVSLCPVMINLTSQTFLGNTGKVTFSWDTTASYVFARVALRVDTIGASWQTAGGFGIFYPSLSINKFGLQSGQNYRAQARTFCDSNITSFRSWWTSPIFWTQPGTIRLDGGTSINNLSVYPNPSRDVFNIGFKSEILQDLSIRILNVVGAEIYSETQEQFVGEYTKQISLDDYVKGIYFLEIETGKGIINKKLILQ